MGLDNSYDNVLATAASPNAFAEHAERLPHAGGITEKYLEAAALLLCFARQQPLFRGFPLFAHAVQLPP